MEILHFFIINKTGCLDSIFSSVICFLFGHFTLILQNNFLLSRLCLFCYSQEAVQLWTFLGKFKVDNIFKLDVKLFVEWQQNYTSLSTYVPSCILSAISRLRGAVRGKVHNHATNGWRKVIQKWGKLSQCTRNTLSKKCAVYG